MSSRLFTQTDLLSRVAKFLPEKSQLMGALANVNVSCNMVFQEISDEKRFEQLRDMIIKAMEDEGYMYEVIEGCQSYFGVFTLFGSEDPEDIQLLYIFRVYEHSVVLSPTGALSAWDNMHIYSKEDWEMVCPWLGLGDLMDLDADV